MAHAAASFGAQSQASSKPSRSTSDCRHRPDVLEPSKRALVSLKFVLSTVSEADNRGGDTDEQPATRELRAAIDRGLLAAQPTHPSGKSLVDEWCFGQQPSALAAISVPWTRALIFANAVSREVDRSSPNGEKPQSSV